MREKMDTKEDRIKGEWTNWKRKNQGYSWDSTANGRYFWVVKYTGGTTR